MNKPTHHGWHVRARVATGYKDFGPFNTRAEAAHAGMKYVVPHAREIMTGYGEFGPDFDIQWHPTIQARKDYWLSGDKPMTPYDTAYRGNREATSGHLSALIDITATLLRADRSTTQAPIPTAAEVSATLDRVHGHFREFAAITPEDKAKALEMLCEKLIPRRA